MTMNELHGNIQLSHGKMINEEVTNSQSPFITIVTITMDHEFELFDCEKNLYDHYTKVTTREE